MSDFTIGAYSEPPKDPKEKLRGDFQGADGVALTKSSHQDPEKHKIGDTLPDTLLAYGEGTGSLPPDLAGNQPRMLRSIQQLNGTGGNFVSTTTPQVIPGLITTLVIPSTAVAPVVVASYATFWVTGGGAGPTPYNDISFDLRSNGTGVPGSRLFGRRHFAGQDSWDSGSKPSLVINVTPGLSYTLAVNVYCTVNTPSDIYTVSPGGGGDTYLTLELYY
jgi:hypothetical protein